jgi:predicted Zn-ribbon and HTH transcriptional regulator
MVTVVKHEWHSHDRQYAIEIDEDILSEIYPDLDEDEIADKLQAIETGYTDIEEIINDAYDNDVDLEWDFQYDDCWTDRKGGYEVTYELGDEDSWHTEPEEPPASHKCTKCRWEGKSWETRTAYINEQGEVLPDDCDEWHDTKDACPMCDSDIALTESGKQEEEARAKRMAEIDTMFNDEDPVDEEELARALEELKQEFENLSAHTHHCTECDWTGNEEDHVKEGICPNCCGYTEKYKDE